MASRSGGAAATDAEALDGESPERAFKTPLSAPRPATAVVFQIEYLAAFEGYGPMRDPYDDAPLADAV